jgi:Helix-turn-helix of insertion element transposase
MSRMQQNATRCNNKKRFERPIDAFRSSRNDLSERQRNAVPLLLQGLSDEQVAAQVGVERTTLFRWRKSIPFARELDRQRKILWQQSASKLQSMVQPALDILRAQLNDTDPKVRIRAAALLLRFATPSRLAPASVGAEKIAKAQDKQDFQDVIDFVEAPLPGQPGAPEDMMYADADDEDDEGEEEQPEDE